MPIIISYGYEFYILVLEIHVSFFFYLQKKFDWFSHKIFLKGKFLLFISLPVYILQRITYDKVVICFTVIFLTDKCPRDHFMPFVMSLKIIILIKFPHQNDKDNSLIFLDFHNIRPHFSRFFHLLIVTTTHNFLI